METPRYWLLCSSLKKPVKGPTNFNLNEPIPAKHIVLWMGKKTRTALNIKK